MKKQFLFVLSTTCLLLGACEMSPSGTSTTQSAERGQAENEADREITQRIRQALMDDDSLSTNAKNSKIMTVNGVVTLRGRVNSEMEKNEISRKVKGIMGVRNVDNQLETMTSERGPNDQDMQRVGQGNR